MRIEKAKKSHNWLSFMVLSHYVYAPVHIAVVRSIVPSILVYSKFTYVV